MATILVIDDDPEVRAMVTRTLERAGNRVFQADNGYEGLDIYRAQQPRACRN